MKHIVIIGGISSAALYIREAIARGYKPIIINPPTTEKKMHRESLGDSAIFMDAKSMDDQDDIVEELKRYDIACIVPGSSGGVNYAERLIDRMGFKGNGFESLWRRDTKSGMHQSLKEAGIRYIRTAVVKCEQDIIDFFRDNGIDAAFMKLSETAGSVNAKKCTSPEDAIAHYRKIKDSDNVFGWKSDVLIQEFIDGTEYIVDSVSCEGKHLITDIWVYRKVLNSEDNVIYESAEVVQDIEPGMHDLIRYAYQVLDATGFKYGPCHGEYKIDKDGPVLIETNLRPMGAALTANYLDEIFGHHITDIALEAYLEPKRFLARMKNPYRPLRMGIIKFIISPKELDVNLGSLLEILKCLKSFRYTNPILEDRVVHIPKTTDLPSCPAYIKLCHPDPNVVRAERDFLHMLEVNYFDLLSSVDNRIPATEIKKDYGFMKEAALYEKKYLVLTNNGKKVHQYGKTVMIPDDSWDTYDGVAIMDTREGTIEGKIRMIRRESSQVINGGWVSVIPEFFERFPYKAVSIEVVLRLLGFRVELPSNLKEGIIYAMKMRISPL